MTKPTILRSELARLAFTNSRRLPATINDNGERHEWVGIGWTHGGPARGDEVATVVEDDFPTRAPGAWGVATVDEGISCTRHTRQAAVDMAGFATPYRREKAGRLYIYTSEEGSVRTIGRVRDLLAQGFTFNDDISEYEL